MQFARLTVIRALPGRKAEAEEVVDSLMAWLKTQKGYIDGWKLKSVDDPDEILRLTIWDDLDSVNAAAIHQENLALRSKLMMLGQEQATTAGGIFELHPYPKADKRKTSAKA